VFAAGEETIDETRSQLAKQGFYMEQTAAVAFAVLTEIVEAASPSDAEPIVVLLTGHGLKTDP
jgi:threonine synthase